jgi:surface antigen
MATVAEYLRLAAAQIGVAEQPAGSNRVKYSTWYGLAGPWCQMLQNWLHVSLGMEPPGYVAGSVPKGSAYTPACADWFAKRGRWTRTPERGALVYFDFPGDGVNRISHVGVVEQVNADGSITTIEGNTDEAGGRTGGKVMRKVRRGPSIVGYGMPDYSEEDEVAGEADRIITAITGHIDELYRRANHGDPKLPTAQAGGDVTRKELLAAIQAVGAQVAALPKPSGGGVLSAAQVQEITDQLRAALPGYTVRIEPAARSGGV